jgi:hypothetical protein
MTTKHIVAAAIAALLLSVPGSAQSASDLLQKGIHAQEAAGDLDSAILIFRQVVNSASTNKALAAQAQYQLVLCMLQKGDRAAASKELAALERNFPEMQDLVAKARKLIPGMAALLPEPWGESECAQLNIKREGVATGEYLYYSADAWANTVDENRRKVAAALKTPYPQAIGFKWELKTKNSTRSILVWADRDTMRPVDNDTTGHPDNPDFSSNDDLGDTLATPFAGPATDVEQSVFLMRRLPLAVGYKTTLPVTSNQFSPSQMELAVTGIETVQTPAGKFNCYKVSFTGIGQTFWIGVEGARPLVKFRSGSVEAELVKVWGAENLLASLEAVVQAAGGKEYVRLTGPGNLVSAYYTGLYNRPLHVTIHKIYTPPAEIAQALQRAMAEEIDEHAWNPDLAYKVRAGTLQTRLIGGQQALSCLLDHQDGPLTPPESSKENLRTTYAVWIGKENAIVELWGEVARSQVGTFRWRFDPIIDAVRIPQ